MIKGSRTAALLGVAALAAAACLEVAAAASYRGESIVTLDKKQDGGAPGEYYLPSTIETVSWGRLPNRNAKPVLSVPSGATVTFDTLSHEGLLEDQGKDPVKYFGGHGVAPDGVLGEAAAIAASALPHDFDRDGPHIVTGPVRVEGAQPGDVLKVEVLSLEPRVPYGVISNRHYKGALVGEFPEGTKGRDDAHPLQPDRYGNVSVFAPVKKMGDRWYGYLKTDRGEIRFPLNPFLGIMGVAPDSEENWSSVPPARIGGNIDINELGVGSTLYLPVEVEGALFYTGDPHFAQGDGEVALTALEGSLRGTLRLTVVKKGDAAIPQTNADNLVSPFAETEKYWIPIGLDEDLDEAMKKSVRESIAFLSRQFGLERHLVYAYLSAAVDYEVSQVVDKTKGIHGLIPKIDFADLVDFRLRAGDRELEVRIVTDALYVDAAEVCSALGLEYARDGERMTVGVPAGKIEMRLDSNCYRLRGVGTYLDVSPLERDGKALLPVYALGEVMGVWVNWSTEGTSIRGLATLR